VALTLWGLAMVVPDLVRVAQPLGSFGFYANNDGLIYDVVGPFDNASESPAWKAGIRTGDRLDLMRLRCSLANPPRVDMRWRLWAAWNTCCRAGQPSFRWLHDKGNRPAKSPSLPHRERRTG
jgi:hypothetical protein